MRLQVKHTIRGKINSVGNLSGNVHISTVIKEEKNYYEGEYTINSSEEDQLIPVENKTMRQDLLIKAVSYDEIENDFGGTTVVIGGM